MSKERKTQVLIFKIKNVFYGIEISFVKEVIRQVSLNSVPDTSFIRGIINLRGEIIPVIDMQVFMGFAGVKRTFNSRIIVLQAGDQVFGLLVDFVAELIEVSEIKMPFANVLGIDRSIIKGFIQLEDKIIIIIEPYKISKISLLEKQA